jgi:hypothetical protein
VEQNLDEHNYLLLHFFKKWNNTEAIAFGSTFLKGGFCSTFSKVDKVDFAPLFQKVDWIPKFSFRIADLVCCLR